MTDLEEENVKLKSMCRAAAHEIEEQWEAHCNEEGYGPVNLLSRLNGEISPAWYPGFLDEEGRKVYNKWLEKWLEKHR